MYGFFRADLSLAGADAFVLTVATTSWDVELEDVDMIVMNASAGDMIVLCSLTCSAPVCMARRLKLSAEACSDCVQRPVTIDRGGLPSPTIYPQPLDVQELAEPVVVYGMVKRVLMKSAVEVGSFASRLGAVIIRSDAVARLLSAVMGTCWYMFP